jgi:predicted secreted protein
LGYYAPLPRDEHIADASEALTESRRGEFTACLRLLETLPTEEAARLALASACWFADLAPHTLPTAEQLLALGGAPAEQRAAALPAARGRARACAIAFDGAGLAVAETAHEQLARELSSAEATLGNSLLGVWRDLAEGANEQSAENARHIARDARAAALAAMLVEATTLEAMVLGELGRFDDALDVARRAARMAQTEGLRQEQYFTSVVLARTRRLVGHPHLASRILSSLRQYASTPWHNWIDWELALSSGAATIARPTPAAAAGVAR